MFLWGNRKNELFLHQFLHDLLFFSFAPLRSFLVRWQLFECPWKELLLPVLALYPSPARLARPPLQASIYLTLLFSTILRPPHP